jgi:hypothetical protein
MAQDGYPYALSNHQTFGSVRHQLENISEIDYAQDMGYEPANSRMLLEDTNWTTQMMLNGDDFSIYYVPSIYTIMQRSNLYAYCMGNPVTYIDPTGNMVWLGELHDAVKSHILYGNPYSYTASPSGRRISMGGIPSPCGRYLETEVKIKYGQTAKRYSGRKSGRLDLLDVNSGEFWEIKSNKTGAGAVEALKDIKIYMMKDNKMTSTSRTFQKKLNALKLSLGTMIPDGTFVYKAALWEYYTVTYKNPLPGVILYDYTQHTKYEEAVLELILIPFPLLGRGFGSLFQKLSPALI